ncbi:MAG: c-type cytochrome [Alphaproteobacteria bacterium]|nr:c-type cytochrome [Alphaproteobacteria bacterium]MDE2041732.1 c-type cytochrome [Alphaproteobacteria bacterium]MDE2341353.1 c-type cytochrome [Alphaproteobacteria bacterium]
MKMKHGLVVVVAMLLPALAQAGAPSAFVICGACHAVRRGASGGIGPTLAGVYGRESGSLPGYQYSPALKAKHVKWTETTLDTWLKSPNSYAPGTKMAYAGQPDAGARKALIAYLKTLK